MRVMQQFWWGILLALLLISASVQAQDMPAFESIFVTENATLLDANYHPLVAPTRTIPTANLCNNSEFEHIEPQSPNGRYTLVSCILFNSRSKLYIYDTHRKLSVSIGIFKQSIFQGVYIEHWLDENSFMMIVSSFNSMDTHTLYRVNLWRTTIEEIAAPYTYQPVHSENRYEWIKNKPDHMTVYSFDITSGKTEAIITLQCTAIPEGYCSPGLATSNHYYTNGSPTWVVIRTGINADMPTNLQLHQVSNGEMVYRTSISYRGTWVWLGENQALLIDDTAQMIQIDADGHVQTQEIHNIYMESVTRYWQARQRVLSPDKTLLLTHVTADSTDIDLIQLNTLDAIPLTRVNGDYHVQLEWVESESNLIAVEIQTPDYDVLAQWLVRVNVD